MLVAAVGQLISGRYLLIEALGHGAVAATFRAHDVQVDREVAVKVLHAHLGDDRKLLRRFAAAARRAASVDDVNVIAIHDIRTDEEPAFIVMELVAEDLGRLIAREAPLAPAHAAGLVADVAAALGAAHRMRIVHGDLKPANVLLTAAGEVRVADFGLARSAGGKGPTLTGTLRSADYLSPEQLRGGRATARSDLYSLGVVLFELLTGNTP